MSTFNVLFKYVAVLAQSHSVAEVCLGHQPCQVVHHPRRMMAMEVQQPQQLTGKIDLFILSVTEILLG